MVETIDSFIEWSQEEKITIEKKKETLYGIQFLLSYNKEHASIQFFYKGTFLIQGKPSFLLEKLQKKYQKIEKSITTQASMLMNSLYDRIGMDEAGKGDYFGPLVVASVYVKKEQETELKKIGIKDSKEILDKKILEFYTKYKNKIPHEMLCLMPEEYNKKYMEFCNLNNLLAWAHAQTLENLLNRIPAQTAILDQFCSPYIFEKKLLSKSKKIKLIQQPKAEFDTAVALASIFARAFFLQSLESLEKRYEITLPKGANKVEQIAIPFIQKWGREKLGSIAKLHFKNTKALRIF